MGARFLFFVLPGGIVAAVRHMASFFLSAAPRPPSTLDAVGANQDNIDGHRLPKRTSAEHVQDVAKRERGDGVEPSGARTGRENERYSVALSAFAASISSAVIRPATDSRMSWAFGLFFSTAR